MMVTSLNLTKRLHQVGILFTLIIASCSPVVSSKLPGTQAVVPLPAPGVKIVRATRSEIEPGTEVTPRPSDWMQPTSLAELAKNVHGDRLIARIEISAIGVLAPVSPVGWMPVANSEYGTDIQWDSAEAGVGWVVSSALPGDSANIVLYGHNNLNASVFLRLGDVERGDEIRLMTGEGEWLFQVDQVKIVMASDVEAMDRAYQEYFSSGDRSSLTILSCWPPANNTHRVIVVAYPV